MVESPKKVAVSAGLLLRTVAHCGVPLNGDSALDAATGLDDVVGPVEEVAWVPVTPGELLLAVPDTFADWAWA